MFTFIKETWKLATMLFTSKPADYTSLEPLMMECYPFRSYKFMSWCGRCVYKKSTYEKAKERGEDISVLKPVDDNHESIHLRQAKDCKTWIKYYWKYVWSWFKISPLFGTIGYYLNKFETEAYSQEENLDYLNRRPDKFVYTFDQDDKRDIWKACDKSSYQYKKYIKEKFKDVLEVR